MTRQHIFTVVAVFLFFYLAVAIYFGGMLFAHPPMAALNTYGKLYWAATWPGFFIQHAFHLNVMPIPSWCFTF